MTDREMELAFLIHEPVATFYRGNDEKLLFYRSGRFAYIKCDQAQWAIMDFSLEKAEEYAKKQGYSRDHLVGGV